MVKFGLEVTAHPEPYESVGSAGVFFVTQQCRITFGIDASYIDEIVVDVLPRNYNLIILGSPYLFLHDVIFYRCLNKYQLVKDREKVMVASHKIHSENPMLQGLIPQ